jgi:hypothetical protein
LSGSLYFKVNSYSIAHSESADFFAASSIRRWVESMRALLAQYDRLLVLHALTPSRMLIRILAQTNSPSRTK